MVDVNHVDDIFLITNIINMAVYSYIRFSNYVCMRMDTSLKQANKIMNFYQNNFCHYYK